MSANYYQIRFNNYERGYIINVLNEKRNSLLMNLEDTEMIDDILLKIIDTEPKCVKKHEQR